MRLTGWKRELIWTVLIIFAGVGSILLIVGIEDSSSIMRVVIPVAGSVLGIRWVFKIHRSRNGNDILFGKTKGQQAIDSPVELG